jgi:transcriptional repressor NrdR
MKKLKKLDEVAYIRFASVYKEFSDVRSFIKEIEGMVEND